MRNPERQADFIGIVAFIVMAIVSAGWAVHASPVCNEEQARISFQLRSITIDDQPQPVPDDWEGEIEYEALGSSATVYDPDTSDYRILDVELLP